MWNNGNGNGNQNGYGQPQYQQQQMVQGYGGEDVYGRMNNSREISGARFPFVEDTGRYALCTLEEVHLQSHGPSARALLKVLESKSGKHPVGSYVIKLWFLTQPPRFPNQPSAADEFADFCRKLKGAPVGYPIGNDIRVLMKERPQDQLARGTVIDAVAVPRKSKTTGKEFTNIYWNNVPQQGQDIAQMRQRLEAEGIPSTGSAQGQFQGAPHPAQMQGQYQGAPGYQQQVQQPQYQQQPQYGAPQGQPQYGQPQQPAAAPQGAPQGVPPGGFLANVPPQGQGNGGGQGGGAW